jgi:hypothetical protein
MKNIEPPSDITNAFIGNFLVAMKSEVIENFFCFIFSENNLKRNQKGLIIGFSGYFSNLHSVIFPGIHFSQHDRCRKDNICHGSLCQDDKIRGGNTFCALTFQLQILALLVIRT